MLWFKEGEGIWLVTPQGVESQVLHFVEPPPDSLTTQCVTLLFGPAVRVFLGQQIKIPQVKSQWIFYVTPQGLEPWFSEWESDVLDH